MLTVFTANNASFRHVDRTANSEELVRLIKELFLAEDYMLSIDGPITLISLEIEEGRALFALQIASRPAVMCYACWDEAKAEIAWEAAENLFFDATEACDSTNIDLGWLPAERPNTPWLVCIQLPEYSRIDENLAAQLEAFGPCIVWALMELEYELRGLE